LYFDIRCKGHALLGLGTEFRSEKILRNILGTVTVLPRKKVLIPRHFEFSRRANSEARNGKKFLKKLSSMEQSKYWTKWLLTRVVETNSYGLYMNSQFEYCQRLPLPWFVVSCFLFRGMVWNSEIFLLFPFYGREFRGDFSTSEGFGREFREFASAFVPRSDIPSCFLFR
jgi:hypothetical protein